MAAAAASADGKLDRGDSGVESVATVGATHAGRDFHIAGETP
jgi:hypothetical protein